MSNRDLEGLLSVVLPVSLAPRKGKHYGTEVIDANGALVVTLWTAEGEPSEREKAYWGDWTPESWQEGCCDSHWESMQDYRTALWLVHILNAAQLPDQELFHGYKVCNRPTFSVDDILSGEYAGAAEGCGPAAQESRRAYLRQQEYLKRGPR